MKKIKLLLSCALLSVCTACTDMLNEENHSKLTPDFFGTVQGFESGLTAAYAGFRSLYGPEEGLHALTNVGTDDMRTANSNRTTDMVTYSSKFNASNEFSKHIWNKAYRQINTCNGLISNAGNLSGISEAMEKRMIGEAKFLRAQYYFLLVQTFGDITLNKEFISSPETSASRTDMLEVYNLIVEDLLEAKASLPASPQTADVLPGKATAAAARHLLAKVYLTLAWVHNKDTDMKTTGNYHQKYYNAARAQEYFKKAYEEASSLISDAPSMGVQLLPDFRDVWKPANENNQEVLWNVQYASGYTDYGGNYPLNHLYVTNYTMIMEERNLNDGRCYVWYRASDWLLNTCFADKANDSRYEGTFQTVWYATKTTGEKILDTQIDGQAYTLKGRLNEVGDTAMWMPGYNMPKEELEKRMTHRGEGKNIYWLVTPEMYTNKVFPTMKKYLDPNRKHYNDNGMRPIIVYRLGETYLIAAEAALMMNQKGNALKYVNELRERAGYEGHKEAMKVTEDILDLDFILDERARELVGEHTRWFDLVRTGKLLERVRNCDDYDGYRNIKWFHAIRPIPQEQIDRVITGDPYPQNEGWD